MRIKPDCIPCILKMVTSAIRTVNEDEGSLKEVLIKILQIPALRGLDWDGTSPEVIEQVLKVIMEIFHNPDPFRTLKEVQNQKGLELYPKMKQVVQGAADPLEVAVQLAILGNNIDLMVSDRSIEVEKSFEKGLDKPLPEKTCRVFREKLLKTKRLVYLGDNSGEVVFDRLLIETIHSLVDLEVFFVVRSSPALNDVTRREAELVGIEQVATVIENGQKAPVPGTILSRCSPEFRDLFQKSDLIISKGGGNFDTLEEEKNHSKDIAFMLLAKCHPYCQYFQTSLYQPILANVFQ